MIITDNNGISRRALQTALAESINSIKERNIKRVLIIPPDYTRLYSGAGMITADYFRILNGSAHVDVMPALGTHEAMTKEECDTFFEGAVPYSHIIVHNWRQDVVKIGEVPAEFVNRVSEGIVNIPIDCEVNRRIVSGEYDLIISIGQVVPHEVVGMANYSKNIFVGCGGSSMINSSHMLGAFYGMERVMGRDYSPVRRVFDYAQTHFLRNVPLMYVMTVTTNTADTTNIHGLYIGNDRRLFEAAVAESQKRNLNHMDKPIKKAVVYLDPREFKSTWLGNKAIYRTRMAMADGGELLILAPGVRRFGEDTENDRLIRKYGYHGREYVLGLCGDEENGESGGGSGRKKEPELAANMSVAAHLIHGSSDGRFNITYATKYLSREAVESAGFNYIPYDEAAAKYNPEKLTDGYVDVDGETIFYISNPALGLWTCD